MSTGATIAIGAVVVFLLLVVFLATTGRGTRWSSIISGYRLTASISTSRGTAATSPRTTTGPIDEHNR